MCVCVRERERERGDPIFFWINVFVYSSKESSNAATSITSSVELYNQSVIKLITVYSKPRANLPILHHKSPVISSICD